MIPHSQKKRNILAGVNSQILLQQGQYPNIAGLNHKRIVNIYNPSTYKRSRKSMNPESRLNLNHSVLNHAVYDEI